MPNLPWKGFHDILHSRILLVVSIAVCVMLFFQLIKIVIERSSSDREIEILEKKNNQLADEYERLERLRAFLETDLFAERQARTKLGYKKPGEKAVVILDTGEQRSAQNTITNQQGSRASMASSGAQSFANVPTPSVGAANALRWWRYFFSNE